MVLRLQELELLLNPIAGLGDGEFKGLRWLVRSRVPGLRVHLAQVADHPRRFGGRWRPRSGLSAQRWGAATGRGAPVPPSRGWRGTPRGSGSEARRRRPRGPGAAATSPGGGRRRAALPEHRCFERSGGRGGAQRGGEGEGGGQGEPLGRERCAEGPRSQFSASRKLLGPAAGQRRRAGRSGAALPRGRGAGAQSVLCSQITCIL